MRLPLLAAAIGVALALGTGTATAGWPDGRDPPRSRALAERGVSLDEAVARAERRYDARAVRAEEQHNGNRLVYRIRLLGADGRVFEVTIDAATGAEL
ncbi:MAG: PepSY domain-containing protein [Gammaproteobacteria bacterium]|nr:PepSY domain-containing protein [Gammaproteobacteria bacterium]